MVARELTSGGLPPAIRTASARSHRKPPAERNPAPLGKGTSAELRDRLLDDLAGLTFMEELDRWAENGLPIKNTLTGDDASLVELAFQEKLTVILKPREASTEALPPTATQPIQPNELPGGGQAIPATIQKSMLTFPEPRRIRNKKHLSFVTKQPCLICERQPCDAHHLRFARPRALGLKVSDEFTVPLCRAHHRELHQTGNEPKWWETKGIDPNILARDLWLKTRPVRHPS